jgi:hypothetical protein
MTHKSKSSMSTQPPSGFGYRERQAWRTRKRIEEAITAMQASGERLVLEELRYRARASHLVIKRVAAELGVKLVPGRQGVQLERDRSREATDRAGVADPGSQSKQDSEAQAAPRSIQAKSSETKGDCMRHPNREAASCRKWAAWQSVRGCPIRDWTEDRFAVWTLRIGKEEIPGRWVIKDREFRAMT